MKARAVLVLAVGLLIAADKPRDDAVREESKKLDDTWVVESIVRDPREKQPDGSKGLKIIIQGEKVLFKVPAGDMLIGGFVIKIDPTRKPKTVDIWSDESSFGKSVADTLKEPPVLGIYELDDDTLRVCWAPLEKRERPTEFSAKAGSRHGLIVLKREKP